MSLKSLLPLVAAGALALDSDLKTDSSLAGTTASATPSKSQIVLLGEKLNSAPVAINFAGLNAGATANWELAGALGLTFGTNGSGSKLETAVHLEGAQKAFTNLLEAPNSHGSHQIATAGLERTEAALKKA